MAYATPFYAIEKFCVNLFCFGIFHLVLYRQALILIIKKITKIIFDDNTTYYQYGYEDTGKRQQGNTCATTFLMILHIYHMFEFSAVLILLR